MDVEQLIRVSVFVGAALCMGGWEMLAPRRPNEPGRIRRWVGNFGVVALGTLLIRLLIPIMPMGLAMYMHDHGWGLLPLLGLPYPLDFVLAFLILDLGIYFQHRAFHTWGPLWRLHRMHHADTFYDFTTGIRFHPFEYLLSMGWKLVMVAALGAPAAAVLLFEVVLNGLAMFNHANGRLPLRLDRVLRLVVVTPDMHRVHHSTDPRELNRNFGFNLPWWDRLFGTYKPQPDLGHENMVIGMKVFREPENRSLARMLAMPFR